MFDIRVREIDWKKIPRIQIKQEGRRIFRDGFQTRMDRDIVSSVDIKLGLFGGKIKATRYRCYIVACPVVLVRRNITHTTNDDHLMAHACNIACIELLKNCTLFPTLLYIFIVWILCDLFEIRIITILFIVNITREIGLTVRHKNMNGTRQCLKTIIYSVFTR